MVFSVATRKPIVGRWGNSDGNDHVVQPSGQLPAETWEFDSNGAGSLSSDSMGETKVYDFSYTVDGQQLNIVINDFKIMVGNTALNQKDLTQLLVSDRTENFNVEFSSGVMIVMPLDKSGHNNPDNPGKTYLRL